MPKFESQASYPYPAGAVFNAAAQAVQNLPGWKLKEVNQPNWYITASVGFSFWSYGENITIQVTEPLPGQPSINALSSSLFALFDFGKNKRNINKLFAEVQSVLAQAGYAEGNQQQGQQAPAATPEQAPASIQCPNCGSSQSPGVRFCTACGKQLAL